MHPYIAAFIRYHDVLDLDIRQESPYYLQWAQMVLEARQHLLEMSRHV